jgi:hypothetical protein
MRIKTTAAFTDKQAKTPEDEDVPAGREMTVTADRGAELIGFGLAVEIEGRRKSLRASPRHLASRRRSHSPRRPHHRPRPRRPLIRSHRRSINPPSNNSTIRRDPRP